MQCAIIELHNFITKSNNMQLWKLNVYILVTVIAGFCLLNYSSKHMDTGLKMEASSDSKRTNKYIFIGINPKLTNNIVS